LFPGISAPVKKHNRWYPVEPGLLEGCFLPVMAGEQLGEQVFLFEIW
jgi:hypothetical protein